jgi:preprotein translocase SecE subunit
MGVQIPPPLPDFTGEKIPFGERGLLGWIESDMGDESSREGSRPLGYAKGAWQQFRQYASEVRIETKRVTWPGMQEVYGTTVMVILTTFLFGIYFWICDQVFQYAVSHALRYFMHRS